MICVSFSAFAQKTNFSGTWKLNKEKTEFGEAPIWIVPQSLTVTQQSDHLVLTRTSLNDQNKEQEPISETLTFNGKPFERTATGKTITTTVQWTNNQSFNLERDGTTKATETWMLADSGKTLVIDRAVVQISNGYKYSIKCYYDKSN